MRLAKFLAQAGVASRRAAEEIVRSGRVRVNGQPALDPAREVGSDDEVSLDGEPVAGAPERVVYAVHKPIGVVSTAHDPQGRPTVVSLVQTGLRLYPVGRLDADTSGLILLTNDGALAYRLTHPSFEVPRTYLARVAQPPVRWKAVRALRGGVELEDGPTAPAYVRLLAPDLLELTLHEGRNRQVRRMCERVGHPVLALQRVRFGPLELGDLSPGAYRAVAGAALEALARAAAAPRRGRDVRRGAGRAGRRGTARSSAGRGRPRRESP